MLTQEIGHRDMKAKPSTIDLNTLRFAHNHCSYLNVLYGDTYYLKPTLSLDASDYQISQQCTLLVTTIHGVQGIRDVEEAYAPSVEWIPSPESVIVDVMLMKWPNRLPKHVPIIWRGHSPRLWLSSQSLRQGESSCSTDASVKPPLTLPSTAVGKVKIHGGQSRGIEDDDEANGDCVRHWGMMEEATGTATSSVLPLVLLIYYLEDPAHASEETLLMLANDLRSRLMTNILHDDVSQVFKHLRNLYATGDAAGVIALVDIHVQCIVCETSVQGMHRKIKTTGPDVTRMVFRNTLGKEAIADAVFGKSSQPHNKDEDEDYDDDDDESEVYEDEGVYHDSASEYYDVDDEHPGEDAGNASKAEQMDLVEVVKDYSLAGSFQKKEETLQPNEDDMDQQMAASTFNDADIFELGVINDRQFTFNHSNVTFSRSSFYSAFERLFKPYSDSNAADFQQHVVLPGIILISSSCPSPARRQLSKSSNSMPQLRRQRPRRFSFALLKIKHKHNHRDGKVLYPEIDSGQNMYGGDSCNGTRSDPICVLITGKTGVAGVYATSAVIVKYWPYTEDDTLNQREATTERPGTYTKDDTLDRRDAGALQAEEKPVRKGPGSATEHQHTTLTNETYYSESACRPRKPERGPLGPSLRRKQFQTRHESLGNQPHLQQCHEITTTYKISRTSLDFEASKPFLLVSGPVQKKTASNGIKVKASSQQHAFQSNSMEARRRQLHLEIDISSNLPMVSGLYIRPERPTTRFAAAISSILTVLRNNFADPHSMTCMLWTETPHRLQAAPQTYQRLHQRSKPTPRPLGRPRSKRQTTTPLSGSTTGNLKTSEPTCGTRSSAEAYDVFEIKPLSPEILAYAKRTYASCRVCSTYIEQARAYVFKIRYISIFRKCFNSIPINPYFPSSLLAQQRIHMTWSKVREVQVGTILKVSKTLRKGAMVCVNERSKRR